MANNKDNKRDEDLEALSGLVNEGKEVNNENNYEELADEQSNKPNMLDDYRTIERDEIPQGSELYPESWQFAYRCPTTQEVAIFSTLNENDQPAIMSAVEDLIRKCVVIFDADRNRQVSAGQINDCHRTFFLLKIRDFYLPASPIEYSSICTYCKEPIAIQLTADKLQYPELNQKLLNAFDGRKFNLIFNEGEEDEIEINFLIPTIDITGRIFKYIVKVYRENNTKDKENKEDKIVFDKKFLLIAPYLYEKGTETVKEIIQKYKRILSNDELFKFYLEIASKAKFDNLDYIITICQSEGCGSEEETQLRFPGGWKNMFINKKSASGYFD